MNALQIRPMEKTDIPLLCRAEDCETPEGLECFARYFSWQQSGECTFLLAFLNEHLAGHLFVFYHECPCCAENVDMSRLADLLVYPAFRSKGIASALLEEGERVAKAAGSHAFLTVDPNSSQGFLQAFYARRGYFVSGMEGDDLVMMKQL